MPWKSAAQARWGHSPNGQRALGGKSAVSEWDASTDFSHLPEKKPMGNWIKKAVEHPGALTAAAKRRGVSKLQEADKESKSSNPKIRARGALGKRFIKKDRSEEHTS